MKKRVNLSLGSSVCSLVLIALLGVLIYVLNQQGAIVISYALYAIVTAVLLLALIYSPMRLVADDKELCIYRSMWVKTLPYSQMATVEMCQPTMAERNVFGSGGFLGHWGWHKDRLIGRYFAYYGRASECFLITLTNGHKYMVGCKDAPEMAQFIAEHLK